MKKSVDPKILYPMTTIEFINPDTLQHLVREVKNGMSLPTIKVIDFKGYYIIYDEEYSMLAANIIGKEQVDIEILSGIQTASWLSEESLEKELKAVGLNALYDFEALGGFKYSEYPVFYKGEK
ncbi:MAG TPA: hypothetical protein H9909_16545 [Candidatus Mediterraneibacter norfolkensis]|nr:hypothetical protein [Candidatus Mediterraneibacter norfolkensis]